MSARCLVVVSLLALAACGDGALKGDGTEELGTIEGGVHFAGAAKFVVWQHNISWFTSAAMAEVAIEHAVTWANGNAPDIFLFQECGHCRGARLGGLRGPALRSSASSIASSSGGLLRGRAYPASAAPALILSPARRGTDRACSVVVVYL